MKNRILALLLCVCILVSWLPVTALAADDSAGTVATEVPDENPQPTQTAPDPTESEPEPTETEPEPTETEPEPTETEPEPTETEPEPTETEPEPTETEPEPTETEPEPTETEPEPTETEPEPTEPSVVASGTCGDQVNWTLDSNGRMVISGEGPMIDSMVNPWVDYRDQILTVRVEDGVTSIGDFAFQSCKFLTSVELADSVTKIGESCFLYCENLTSIQLPDQITDIGDNAFQCCTSLTSVELPDSLSSISAGLFYYSGLVELEIPHGVTEINNNAFMYCENLTSIQLPDQITDIWDGAFQYCTSLTSVELPSSLRSIRASLFYGSGLVELEIPYGVTEIKGHAFMNCENLETLIIPPTVTTVPSDSFTSCPNLTIYAQENTYIHYFALEYEIPVVILPDDPNEPQYSISGYCSIGGTAAVSSAPSPAYRYIAIEVIPDAGYALHSLYLYYDSQEELNLRLKQIDDTTFAFLMPPCDVFIDVEFLLAESPFVDITPSDYFYTPVLWAVTYGITQGTDATHFSPNSACTRAQVVTFLWRVAGEPEPQTKENPFTDIKPSDYYYKAVLWAVENGITNGTGNGKFSPNAGCTRAQVVTFLWRALGEPDHSSDHNPFVDLDSNQYYYDAVLWALEYEVTDGMDSTHFFPNRICTRGQIVTFLYRTFA